MLRTICINCIFMQSALRQIDRQIQFSVKYAAHIDRYSLASCMLHTQIDTVQRHVCHTHRQIQFSVIYAAHIDKYSLASCMLHIDRYSLSSCLVQRHVCCTQIDVVQCHVVWTYRQIQFRQFSRQIQFSVMYAAHIDRYSLASCMLHTQIDTVQHHVCCTHR